MKFVKSQIAIVEFVFVMIIILSFSSYLFFNNFNVFNDFSNVDKVNSFVDSFCFLNSYKDLILNENLDSNQVSQNWDGFVLDFSKSISFFKIVLEENDKEKIIFDNMNNCFDKFFIKRIFFYQKNNQFNIRILKVGVCI